MTQNIVETISPHPNVLVYGSGLSGVSAALRLAHEDVCVDILQTSEAENSDAIPPGCFSDLLADPAMLKRLREEARSHGNIIFIPANAFKQVIAADQGFLLMANSGKPQKLEYGTIIFAPERVEQLPDNEYDAINLTQLYSKLTVKEKIRGVIVFLLDHQKETRSEVFKDVLHAALYLQKQPNTEVWVLSKQVQVALQGQEELYDQCREAGVIFVKYCDDIEVNNSDGYLELNGFDTQVGAEFTISRPDTLIIPQKTVLPSSALTFAQSLKIRILNGQYTQPDSLWRLPNETNRSGIFAVGASRGNMDRQAIMNDAISVVLSIRERLKPEGIAIKEHIPIVDKGKCVYCLTCVRTCPFGAMERGKGQGMAASINLSACQACGTCVAECPAGALQLRNEILDFRLEIAN